jgi:hypothetical protein
VAQEGWQGVERQPLSFRLPPGFRELDVVSTDQWSRRYEAAEGPAYVHFDYGAYASALRILPAGLEVRARCRETIGGVEAEVMTGRWERPNAAGNRYAAAATWADVPPGARLTVWAEAPDREEAEALLAALRTVRFAPPPAP